MNRLSAAERFALVLAGIFMFVGAYAIIHPMKVPVAHPGSGFYQSVTPRNPPPKIPSPKAIRVYGMVSVGMGVLIAASALWQPRKGGSRD